MIGFFFEQIESIDFNQKILIEAIEVAIKDAKGIVGDISVVFVSDEYLLKMNNQFLKHDYFTDVITFDYSDINLISGDIFISLDRVSDNANQLNVSFKEELYRVVIHGILHLLGYEDKEPLDKAKMTSKEDEYLNLVRDVE